MQPLRHLRLIARLPADIVVPMTALKVALAQVNTTVGDLPANVAVLRSALERAAEAGASIVTFPELALCGYPPEDLLLRPAFLSDCRAALCELAGACRDVTAIVGFPEASEGRVYNAAAVLADGRVHVSARKAELPNYGVFDEKRYFTPGDSLTVIERGGARLAVTVCEDIWVEDGPVERWVRESGTRVVLNVSASPFHAGKLGERTGVIDGFAARTGAHVLYNNLVGGQDELVFDGGSLAVSPDGGTLASAARFAEDMLVVDLAVGEDGGVECAQGELAPEPDRLSEIRAALVLGTRDYVRKNGFEKVVLGLSGGIDSALTAALAVEALGAGNVIGVTMPSEFTSDATRSDAGKLAENLSIELLTLPIRKVHRAYLEVLGDRLGAEPGLAGENVQARVRGNLLMALSNARGWLVLTTGNKSESAVGYCTLYGDTAGGFAVIKDVFKTVVYELAREINATAGREVIPESTIARPPTAELRPDQLDSDSLPAYELLDPILRAYVEEDRSQAEIAAAGSDPELVARVVRMVDRAEFKRRQTPPGVKITPKAFGRDRRLPITNRYRPSSD
jgi:NAD+ synthase (glutamine-hydrolysing)